MPGRSRSTRSRAAAARRATVSRRRSGSCVRPSSGGATTVRSARWPSRESWPRVTGFALPATTSRGRRGGSGRPVALQVSRRASAVASPAEPARSTDPARPASASTARSASVSASAAKARPPSEPKRSSLLGHRLTASTEGRQGEGAARPHAAGGEQPEQARAGRGTRDLARWRVWSAGWPSTRSRPSTTVRPCAGKAGARSAVATLAPSSRPSISAATCPRSVESTFL